MRQDSGRDVACSGLDQVEAFVAKQRIRHRNDFAIVDGVGEPVMFHGFGDIRLYPFAQVVQQTDPSPINSNGGETLANGAILPLSPVAGAGDGDMKLLIGMLGPGTVHLIVDGTGYFQ